MALQSWVVAETVAGALGVEVDAEQRALGERRLASGAPLPLVEAVAESATFLRVAFLRRDASVEDVRGLLAHGAFPAVLVPPATGDVIVLTGRANGHVRAIAVRPDGTTAEERLAPDALVGRAAAGGSLLLPIDVGATVGETPAAGETAPHLTPMQRLLALLARERKDIGLVYLYATLVGLLSLTLPLAVQLLVQMVQGGLFLQPTVLLIAFVVLGTLASGALGLAQLHVVEVIQQRVFARVALELGFKVPRLPFETTLTNALPETMNRFFEVVTIQKSLSKLLTEATTALLQVVFGLVLLTVYHPYFTLFGLVLVGALWLVFRLTGPQGLASSLAESKYKYRAVHWLEEMARAMTAFKFSGASPMPVARMDDLVTGYLTHRRRHFGVLVQQAWAIILFKTVITGGLLILGSVLVIDRQITLGQFVASEIVIVTVLAGLEKLIGSISTVYDFLTALEKLGHVSDLPLERAGGLAVPPPAAGARGFDVRLAAVSYRYPAAAGWSLRDVTLDLAPGERVAVLGADGAGQSTLLRVMGGLLDGYEGTIAYDGLTLRDLDRHALRAEIGQMLSLHDLFDGTIEENVTVGRPGISSADVLRALEASRLAAHVQALPLGLASPVAAGGGTLSVSNAKKLLLAQAIVGRPRLLLLEDIVQHLEGDDREAVIRTLCDRAQPWTLVIVTHDPLLLAACDRVVLLEEGRVALEGPFDRIADDPRLRALVPALRAAA